MEEWKPKLGDVVTAIGPCYMNGDKRSPTLIVGKSYTVEEGSRGRLCVTSECDPHHYFTDEWHIHFKPAESTTNDAGEDTSLSVDETLEQRGDRYGKFEDGAELSQLLQQTIFMHKTQDYTPAMRESITMICHKLARIANGDPTYDDNWRDIAGYATLVVEILNGEGR